MIALAAAVALGAALAGAPGCPAALARAGALEDARVAGEARALVAALGADDPQEVASLIDEAERAAGAGSPATGGDAAARAAAGARFRAALARDCALAAQPRLPAAGPAARARAQAILDQPRFRAARADRAAALGRLRALWRRLLDLLQTGEAQEYAAVTRALFLAAAAAAAVLGAAALLRRRRDARAARPAPAAGAPAAAPPPDARLDAAEAAAARGDAAAAVRLALLAALAGLERDGSVPPGRSFTNGELRALLRGAAPERRAAARTLSLLFDRTVYGGQPPALADAAAALAAARALVAEEPRGRPGREPPP